MHSKVLGDCGYRSSMFQTLRCGSKACWLRCYAFPICQLDEPISQLLVGESTPASAKRSLAEPQGLGQKTWSRSFSTKARLLMASKAFFRWSDSLKVTCDKSRCGRLATSVRQQEAQPTRVDRMLLTHIYINQLDLGHGTFTLLF